MNSAYQYYPEFIQKDLKLRQFYVQLSNIFSNHNLKLVLLDRDKNFLEDIYLENTPLLYGLGIVFPKKNDTNLSIWFDAIHIDPRVVYIRLILTNKDELNSFSVRIYNKNSLKLIYKFNYVDSFMNKIVLSFKKIDNFFILE